MGFLRDLRDSSSLRIRAKPLLRHGEAHESEDHAGILVGGVGNGVRGGKGIQWRSNADLLARQALLGNESAVRRADSHLLAWKALLGWNEGAGG